MDRGGERASGSRAAAAGSVAWRGVILLQGAITILASVFLWPLGGVLVLFDCAGAVLSRGVERAFFAFFAVSGAAALCLVLLFGLMTSVTQQVTVVGR